MNATLRHRDSTRHVSLRTGMLTLAAGLAIAVPCVLADPPANDNPSTTQPQPMKHTSDQRTWRNTRAPRLIPAEWALGKNVVSATNNDKLGDISDLLINTSDSRVEYALVSHGGVLGIGAKVIAIPINAFSWNEERKEFVLPMTKDEFKNAPVTDEADWKYLSDAGRNQKIYDFYHVSPITNTSGSPTRTPSGSANPPASPSASPNGSAAGSNEAAPTGTVGNSPSTANNGNPPDADGRGATYSYTPYALATGREWPLVRLSKIKGEAIKDAAGNKLGTVKDVVFDVSSGRVAFAVLSVDTTLGMGGSMIPVPINSFTVDANDNLMATNALTTETIKSAPRIEKSDWRELKQTGYVPNVYKHYGFNDAWNESPDSDRANPNGKMTHHASTDKKYSDYDTAYSNGTATNGTGTVLLVTQVRPMNDMPELWSAAIHTDDGRDVTIQLAPDSYLSEQHGMLKTGDHITYSGHETTINGKKVVLVDVYTPPSGAPVTVRNGQGYRVWNW